MKKLAILIFIGALLLNMILLFIAKIVPNRETAISVGFMIGFFMGVWAIYFAREYVFGNKLSREMRKK